MKLLEDILTNDDIKSIGKLSAYQEHHFDQLVLIAGLNPKVDLRHANLRMVDFRAADLRGFDFTGADLRYSTRDDSTIIDDSTILSNALIEWITEEEVPIVDRMLEAQAAVSTHSRRRALQDLTDNHSSSNHINKYLVRSIETAGNLEAALDFCDFLIGPLSPDIMHSVSLKITGLLVKKRSEILRRTRRKGTTGLAVEKLIEQLSRSESAALQKFYAALMLGEAEKEENKTSALPGYVQITYDDLIAAAKTL